MLFPSARNTWIGIAALALLCTPLWAGGQVIGSDETQTTTKVVVEATPPGTRSSASVAIVVDHSAAAKGRTEQLKKAVSEFLKSFSTEHEACVYLAGERPTLVQDFTSDAEALSGALKRLKPRGKLAAYDTLAAAADHVRSDATNEKSTVVAFLAGDDDASRSSASELEAKLRGTRNVALFAITLPGRSWESQSTLQELAVSSGGRASFLCAIV